MTEFENKLQAYRDEIDAIDDKMIDLLNQRAKIVEKVGELKAEYASGKSIIRPGREATMVRRMVKLSKGKFPKAAIASLWRTIIAGSSNIEEHQKISVFAGSDKNEHYYWLAREYFGSYSAINRNSTAGRVISDVTEGRANVGVLPMPQDDEENWWAMLADLADKSIKIYAKIPLLEGKGAARNNVSAMAIGKIEPENTGDDTTVLCVKLADNVSRTKINTAFAKVNLKANLTAPTTLDGKVENFMYIFEVPEFLTADDSRISLFKKELDKSLHSITILGAYANALKL